MFRWERLSDWPRVVMMDVETEKDSWVISDIFCRSNYQLTVGTKDSEKSVYFNFAILLSFSYILPFNIDRIIAVYKLICSLLRFSFNSRVWAARVHLYVYFFPINIGQYCNNIFLIVSSSLLYYKSTLYNIYNI